MLQGGSFVAGISINHPLFGISNLKAKRYAVEAIDHGAEDSTGRNDIADIFNCSSSMIRRSKT